MPTPLEEKSSLNEIETRFDKDVERFSNLETGQSATIDAPLAMDLITLAAVKSTKKPCRFFDIGCGAGNNTLKLLTQTSPFDCDLVDLSFPMLEKAKKRISAVNSGKVKTFQEDFRKIDPPGQGYDVIIAAAVLHHLRDDQDWEMAFKKLYQLTAPGGSVWITDLVSHESEHVESLMGERYGAYLCSIGGAEYRKKVLETIDKEDSPRPVTYQLDLLRKVGYAHTDILHKNACYAAFGAVKAR